MPVRILYENATILADYADHVSTLVQQDFEQKLPETSIALGSALEGKQEADSKVLMLESQLADRNAELARVEKRREDEREVRMCSFLFCGYDV